MEDNRAAAALLSEVPVGEAAGIFVIEGVGAELEGVVAGEGDVGADTGATIGALGDGEGEERGDGDGAFFGEGVGMGGETGASLGGEVVGAAPGAWAKTAPIARESMREIRAIRAIFDSVERSSEE
ncbi:hypothetical protein KFK09_024919 [Dendrobium nobile]|uniref:Uncharacterized protein n=1 Tax=Dendrobium nobile TaxID=94219 RepID=A0A8T3ADY5_DENNO|nr:hypothetical protein KFK09_024919 [Dendrobium nobile]